MPQIDFFPYATDTAANVLNQAGYVSTTKRQLGLTSGRVASDLLNKILRQGSVGTYVVAKFIADTLNIDVLDNGDTNTLATNFELAVNRVASAGFVERFAVDTGSANRVVVAPSPVVNTYQPGVACWIQIFATNSDATTLSMSGLPDVALVRNTGSPLVARDIVAGDLVLVVYTGSQFRLLGNTRNQILNIVRPLTPAGAQKSTAYTAYALTDISGVSQDNTAQTLNFSGGTYVDCQMACSIFYNNTTGNQCNVTMRPALAQGSNVVSADIGIGATIATGSASPMSVRQVFQGLDPTKTYELRMIVQKGQNVSSMNVNNAYIIAYYG